MKIYDGGYYQGHPLATNREEWRYQDTGELCGYAGERACVKCGQFPTKDGHDACIANMPMVANACCGHGVGEPYLQLNYFYCGVYGRTARAICSVWRSIRKLIA